jgi:hypothetical protein
MPDLEHSLHGHDLGHLRIIADSWGVGLDAPDVKAALPELTHQLLDADLVAEIFAALPEEAAAALTALKNNAGRLPWGQFTRRFGKVREIGPGRRDRQRPDQNPISAAEVLWYRALVARAFFDTPRGTEEFAYIPSDLLPLIPAETEPQHAAPMGRVATAAERAHPLPADEQIIQHACTLLAAIRVQHESVPLPNHMEPFLRSLLHAAGMLTSQGDLNIEATRAHLEAPPGEALRQLAHTWLTSTTHNDLHLVPHLQAEGEWDNDPLAARQFIIKLLNDLPADTWWSTSAFIADIHQAHPDFQRPASDYDSWYLRDTRTDEFLRGFEHWYQIEGALIRYLITGPLHWLGLIDLAVPEEESPPQEATSFRRSRWAAALLQNTAPEGIPEESASLHIRSNGKISAPVNTPRSVRYQIARFCHWDDSTPHEYRYHLSPDSLERARQQGLKIGHLLRLCQEHAAPVPPNIIKALQRWEQHRTEIQIEEMVVLRVESPSILKALQDSRAARFLGIPLGPTAIMVKRGAEEKVLAALLEMGYLGKLES